MGLLTPKTGPFHRIGDRYATFFDLDHFMGRSAFEESWIVKAPKNIIEKEKSLVMEIAVPGFEKGDISVQVFEDRVYISGEKSAKITEGDYLKKEVPTRIEPQVIPLPSNADQDHISAAVRNGMLYLTIPFTDEINHAKKKVLVN